MVKKLIHFFLALIVSFPLLSKTIAGERFIRIYNWSDYIDKTILDDFSKETGIQIIYDVFDSNEMLETKLLAGGSGYDLVVPSGQFLSRQIDAGVFQKLDKSKIPNLAFAWDLIKEKTKAYDPENQYSVNYMWGTTGIGYNVDKIQKIFAEQKIDSWDFVLKPENLKKFQKCGIYFLDQAQDIIPLVLNFLGFNPNSQKKEDLLKAQDVLMSLRPFIRKFNSSEYIDALANGDICIAVGWSGDILQARKRAEEANRGIKISYVLPKEGTEIWFDQMAIPIDAKNVEEAHEFINYMMKPEIIARASNHIYYANGNKESQKFIKKDILEDHSIYPDDDFLKNLFTVKPFNQKKQRQINRLWIKITTGR